MIVGSPIEQCAQPFFQTHDGGIPYWALCAQPFLQTNTGSGATDLESGACYWDDTVHLGFGVIGVYISTIEVTITCIGQKLDSYHIHSYRNLFQLISNRQIEMSNFYSR